MAIEIVDFPIKKWWFFHCYVSSPEGNMWENTTSLKEVNPGMSPASKFTIADCRHDPISNVFTFCENMFKKNTQSIVHLGFCSLHFPDLIWKNPWKTRYMDLLNI